MTLTAFSPPLPHLLLLSIALANPHTVTNAHPLGERGHNLVSRAKADESSSYGNYVAIVVILVRESLFTPAC